MDKEPRKLLDNLEQVSGHIFQATFQLFERTEINFEYNGTIKNGFNGYAILKVHKDIQCYKGKCEPTTLKAILGNFENGLLDGLVTIIDGFTAIFVPMKNGIVHGLVISKRIFTNIVRQVIPFTNGRPSQNHPGWIGLTTWFSKNTKLQGFLHGIIGENGKLNGSGVYFYPNTKMVLIGQFKDNHMVSARKAFIKDIQAQQDQLHLSFTDPEGPEMHLDTPTNVSMGTQPLVPEPYETITVEVKPSGIPNAGQGLFALRTIKEHELVSFYNGLRIPVAQFSQHIKDCLAQTNGSDGLAKEQTCHKNALNAETENVIVDIPPFWNDLKRYNATLAHYANHQFEPKTNVQLGIIDHPRFGKIHCLVASKTIRKGQEIFLDYSFDVNDVISQRLFPWYF